MCWIFLHQTCLSKVPLLKREECCPCFSVPRIYNAHCLAKRQPPDYLSHGSFLIFARCWIWGWCLGHLLMSYTILLTTRPLSVEKIEYSSYSRCKVYHGRCSGCESNWQTNQLFKFRTKIVTLVLMSNHCFMHLHQILLWSSDTSNVLFLIEVMFTSLSHFSNSYLAHVSLNVPSLHVP